MVQLESQESWFYQYCRCLKIQRYPSPGCTSPAFEFDILSCRKQDCSYSNKKRKFHMSLGWEITIKANFWAYFYWFVREKIQIAKDKCLFDVETTCNDILSIFESQVVSFLQGKIFPQKLFVIGQLNNKGYVKCVLQPSEYNYNKVKWYLTVMLYK